MAQVTTFYSYKGGSGRSMTMANVAWALASNGHKVLVIDWDLEAPGLHRYFHPFLADPEQGKSTGLIDRIWDYVDSLDEAPDGRFALARCDDIVQPLDLPIRGKGGIDLLGAGRQNEHYSGKVGGLDWATFYARFDGEAFITKMMTWARSRYSHILIDSRTGVADTAGICTAQIPDALVMCFVYNRQSIEGTAAIAASVAATRKKSRMAPLSISYVPSRVEERSAVESARSHAAVRLARTIGTDRSEVEHALRRDEIRHYAWCSFEEKLAVFEDVPDERGSLLDAIHALAERVADTELEIAVIDPAVLTSYWQRAAFDDPRIVELRAIKDGPLDIYWTRLFEWVEEALYHEDERLDWIIEVAEAAVEMGGQSNDRLPDDAIGFLATSGLELARRTYVHDARQYRIRYALLLQTRAAHLLKRGDAVVALELAVESAELFGELSDPVSRWRCARSIELRAEALEAKGDLNLSLLAYREAAEAYQSIARQHMPLGTEIDQPRALRQLAEKLLEAGEDREADTVAARAVSQLRRLAPLLKTRQAGEIIAILGVRAETAIALEGGSAASVVNRMRVQGDKLLPRDVDRRRLDRRLALAQVRGALSDGNPQEAVSLLQRMGVEEPLGPRETLLKAQALLEDGDEARAADLLIEALADPKFPISPETLALLEHVLRLAGREAEFVEIVLTRALERDGANASSWLPLVLRMLERGDPLHIDTSSPIMMRHLTESSRNKHVLPWLPRKKS